MLISRCLIIFVLAALGLGAAPACARSMPIIDTEDATLGSAPIASTRRVHPLVGLDLRNGDFARADYDDDRADLGRLPVHAQLGLAIELSRDTNGEAKSWIFLRSSNGFHAPGRDELSEPRSWYESNNLAALVLTPAKGVRAALVYTIKTSPNAVSDTTHEASLSLSYGGKDALGSLAPTFVMTMRPKGGDGVFMQAGIEPEIRLFSTSDPLKLSLPIAVGVGWKSFYSPRSGDRGFASAGCAVEQTIALSGTRLTARAEALALVRDRRLARLSGPEGEIGTVVPLVTLSLSLAY
jgi:hypothetical protein